MSTEPTLDLLKDLDIPSIITHKLNSLRQSEYFSSLDQSGIRAVERIIVFALEAGWNEEQIDRFLFNPVIPSQEQINIFRTQHQNIYREQAISLANQVDESIEQFFAITSSMYAGKSTLAAEVCEQLSEKGYRVIAMVPHFMSDEENANFITLRGREVKDGDDVGKDGFTRINAVPYNHDNYQQLIDSFGIKPTDKVVIHFDEFSFLPSECILEFIHYVTVNYSNVKILFVGLDKNALGAELAGYVAIKETVAAEFACKSFVPNSIDSSSEIVEPTGTYTSRYLVLPDGVTVLDCGFLPVAVPKEFAQLVHYTPANEEQHMHTILNLIEQFELLDSIVNPTDAQQELRESLFNRLKMISLAIES